MGCSFCLKLSTLSILNYFLKVATMRGFSNISVTSCLGVVVVSYSLNNMAASGARDERSKEDE